MMVFISKRYKVANPINQGHYCTIFSVNNEIACKIGLSKTQPYSLEHEHKLMIQCKSRFVAEVGEYFRESECEGFELELLGLNLLQVDLDFTKYKQLVYQLFSGVQQIHNRGVLHRDIKPQNVCLSPNCSWLSLKIIDFGLSATFDQANTYKDNQVFVGSVLYCSPLLKCGRAYKKLDDYWSTYYTIVGIIKGQLPWNTVEIKQSQEKQQIVNRIKLNIDLKTLCEGLPNYLLAIGRLLQDWTLTQEQSPDITKVFNILQQQLEITNLQSHQQAMVQFDASEVKQWRKKPRRIRQPSIELDLDN